MKSKRPAARVKKTMASGALAPKLAGYSATAAAALVFAPNAQAQIVNITSFNYSGLTNTTTPPSFILPATQGSFKFAVGPFAMNFNGVRGPLGPNGSKGPGQVEIIGGATGNVSFAVDSAFALNLAPHAAIPHSYLDYAAVLADFRSYSGEFRPRGSFFPGPIYFPHAKGAVTGYVGFRATHAGNNYYGWLNVKVAADTNGEIDTVSLVAKNGDPGVFGAYDISTDPNSGSFGAGDAAASVPEPADTALGLGLLTFGAAGVREMRRRRKLVA